jgi:dUTP pyrophosphatase
MKVNFKKLNPLASIPSRSKEGDAGYDMTAVDVELNNNILTVHTGIAIEIPRGYAGFLFPRSSICKTDLSLTNSVGVIDSNYRGEIMCKFRINDNVFEQNNDNLYIINSRNKPRLYSVGDRCCQLIILPVPDITFEEQSELSSSERGAGGFGSTGN